MLILLEWPYQFFKEESVTVFDSIFFIKSTNCVLLKLPVLQITDYYCLFVLQFQVNQNNFLSVNLNVIPRLPQTRFFMNIFFGGTVEAFKRGPTTFSYLRPDVDLVLDHLWALVVYYVSLGIFSLPWRSTILTRAWQQHKRKFWMIISTN